MSIADWIGGAYMFLGLVSAGFVMTVMGDETFKGSEVGGIMFLALVIVMTWPAWITGIVVGTLLERQRK